MFLADPKAPIAAVAERAGVGISALYRRYDGKEDLLRQLCHDGLRRFIAEAEAVATEPDGWQALTRFLERVVETDVHSLTVHLAGTFTPTAEMYRDADRANDLVAELSTGPATVAGYARTSWSRTSCWCWRAARQNAFPMPAGPVTCASGTLRWSSPGWLGMAKALHPLPDPPLPGPPPEAGELNWRWAR